MCIWQEILVSYSLYSVREIVLNYWYAILCMQYTMSTVQWKIIDLQNDDHCRKNYQNLRIKIVCRMGS